MKQQTYNFIDEDGEEVTYTIKPFVGSSNQVFEEVDKDETVK